MLSSSSHRLIERAAKTANAAKNPRRAPAVITNNILGVYTHTTASPAIKNINETAMAAIPFPIVGRTLRLRTRCSTANMGAKPTIPKNKPAAAATSVSALRLTTPPPCRVSPHVHGTKRNLPDRMELHCTRQVTWSVSPFPCDTGRIRQAVGECDERPGRLVRGAHGLRPMDRLVERVDLLNAAGVTAPLEIG